jgi:catalase
VTEPWTPINEKWTGQAVNFKFGVTYEDFVEASALWDVLGRTADQQEHLIYNVASRLKDSEAIVRERTYGMFSKVNEGLGKRIEGRVSSHDRSFDLHSGIEAATEQAVEAAGKECE